MIGVSPLKKGPEGKVSVIDFKYLCTAFESKLRIEQMNAKVCTRQTQIEWIIKMMKYNTVEAESVVKRLCRDTASDIAAGI